jgi:hypothetical protein
VCRTAKVICFSPNLDRFSGPATCPRVETEARQPRAVNLYFRLPTSSGGRSERCEDSLVAALAPGYPWANGVMGFAHMAGESVDLEPETPDRSVLLTEALN